MATNDYKQWGVGGSPNVLSQASYIALSALGPGYADGATPNANAWNKTLRQATMASSALAQIIVDTGVDALDDGNMTNYKTNLLTALNAQPKAWANLTGVPSVTAGTGMSGGGALTASVTLGLASMAQSTIKGRAAGAGTGAPTDLTAAQVAGIVQSALVITKSQISDLPTIDNTTANAVSANTLVQRNASGDIGARYLFTNAGVGFDNDASTVGQIAFWNGSDGALRHGSVAHVAAAMTIAWGQITGFPYTVDVSASGSTIMQRNGSGYAFATYFNQSSALENSAISAIFFEAGGDGYHRKMSLANFVAQAFVSGYGSGPTIPVGGWVFARFTAGGPYPFGSTIGGGSLVTSNAHGDTNGQAVGGGTFMSVGHYEATTADGEAGMWLRLS